MSSFPHDETAALLVETIFICCSFVFMAHLISVVVDVSSAPVRLVKQLTCLADSARAMRGYRDCSFGQRQDTEAYKYGQA